MISPAAATKIINRVAKWRAHFAGWQLGTRLKDDPESQAVRDAREVLIMLRIEGSALASLLIAKGLFSAEEFTSAVAQEALILETAFEGRWPGATATEEGMAYDLNLTRPWMSKWRP